MRLASDHPVGTRSPGSDTSQEVTDTKLSNRYTEMAYTPLPTLLGHRSSPKSKFSAQFSKPRAHTGPGAALLRDGRVWPRTTGPQAAPAWGKEVPSPGGTGNGSNPINRNMRRGRELEREMPAS